MKLPRNPSIRPKKPIAFDFVLEALADLEPYTKPMFGSHGLYVGDKIMLILRDRDSYPDDNGVWLATSAEFHESLQKDLPSMRSIYLFGDGPTNWQNLPKDSSDFEESVLKVCDFILKQDPRIGHVPKSKNRSSKKKKSEKKKKPVKKPASKKSVKKKQK